MSEFWDLYDKNRQPLDETHKRGLPIPQGKFHLVVDIWLINRDGNILLTQRHPDKPFGLLWECIGGSVIAGEDSLTGALRELKEEIGVTANPEELFLFHSTRLNDRFVDTYMIEKDVSLSDLRLQPEEVIDAQFVSLAKLDVLWSQNLLVPKERYEIYRHQIALYTK